LAEDIDCRRCGYNLRGLNVDGRCPECTTPVGRSVHGDVLQFCDPEWVDRLAGGMRLYVFVIMFGILFGLVAGLGVAISMVTTGGMPAPVVFGLIMFSGIFVAIQLLVYWKITAPDPGRDETAHPITARAVARFALIVASVLGFVVGLVDANKLGVAIISSSSPVVVGVRWALAVPAVVVGLIGMGALFVYAISLARRFPDDVLAARTRIVMWGFLVTAGLMQSTELMADALIPGSANPTQTEAIFGVIIAVLAIPGLVFWIWGIVLLYKYRNRLMRAARRARETWARTP
jgi:hypothetical protein